jgi:A/G-specific adenine glycosylase
VRGDDDVAKRLRAWFERERRDLPWRRTRDPYAIWISEVMLQQTQVRTVIPFWERWMRELPDVAALAAAGEARVLKLWEGLGYYRRARHLHAAARVIRDRHGGVFPADEASIQALPGIGRYTAGAIASIAFGRPAPILDGNVIRVLTRLRAIPENPASGPVRERLWAMSESLVQAAAATGEPDACSDFNQALMELGALVCTPRDPACDRCPLARGCAGRKSGDPRAFPATAARPRTSVRRFVVLVAQAGDRFCVRQRPATAVNGGLWEFPNVEIEDPGAGAGASSGPATADEVAAVAEQLFGKAPSRRSGGAAPEFLGEIRHAITRYRMRQQVYRLRVPRLTPALRRLGTWESWEQLRARPFSSAHRRVLGWLDPKRGLHRAEPGVLLPRSCERPPG